MAHVHPEDFTLLTIGTVKVVRADILMKSNRLEEAERALLSALPFAKPSKEPLNPLTCMMATVELVREPSQGRQCLLALASPRLQPHPPSSATS